MTFAGEFLGLPGLRGYWPMGAFDSSGNAIDQSGNGRTLTYNGNPTHNYTTQGAAYIDLDGTGDYLSHADHAGLDILGTESYVASAVRGLTVGGWVYFDALGTSGVTNRPLITKLASGTQQSYGIYLRDSAANIRAAVSSDGSAVTVVDSSVTISTATWYFAVLKYEPSTRLSITVTGTKTSNTTSIPASIFNSTSALELGRLVGSQVIDGRLSNFFLCAMALSDTAIDNIYQNTKASYGL